MFGGTHHVVHPDRYTYWRVGYGAAEHYCLDFHVERAGEFHCKRNYATTLADYSDAIQVYYQFQGRATLTYGAETVPVNPGDLIIIPAGHAFRYQSAQGLRYHWFCLIGDWPTMLGRRPSIQTYALGADKITQTLFAEIRETLITGRSGYPLQAIGVVYSLLARLFELTATANVPKSAYPDTVRQAIIYLCEHYVEPYHAPQVAAAVGVSLPHLRALFAKWVGESPQRLHRRYKIDAAKRLLEQRISITQTAHEVGYKDVRYFSRIFKQVTGMTPTAYKTLVW